MDKMQRTEKFLTVPWQHYLNHHFSEMIPGFQQKFYSVDYSILTIEKYQTQAIKRLTFYKYPTDLTYFCQKYQGKFHLKKIIFKHEMVFMNSSIKPTKANSSLFK